MPELFTEAEIQQHLRREVADAGSAKLWLRQEKIFGKNHILHMIENGSAATLDDVLAALKFRRVIRYEPIND